MVLSNFSDIQFCFAQNDCAEWADSKRAHEAEMCECICHALLTAFTSLKHTNKPLHYN